MFMNKYFSIVQALLSLVVLNLNLHREWSATLINFT